MARLREMVEGAGSRLEPGWGVEARARPLRALAALARSAPGRPVRAGRRARARQVKQRSNGTRAGSADAYYTSPCGDIFRLAARSLAAPSRRGTAAEQRAVSRLVASGACQCGQAWRGCQAASRRRHGLRRPLGDSGVAARPVRAAQRRGFERPAGRAGRARRWRARSAWRPSTQAATARATPPRRAWMSTWPRRTSRRCCSTWPCRRPSAPRPPARAARARPPEGLDPTATGHCACVLLRCVVAGTCHCEAALPACPSRAL